MFPNSKSILASCSEKRVFARAISAGQTVTISTRAEALDVSAWAGIPVTVKEPAQEAVLT
jgi:hypothetical protein